MSDAQINDAGRVDAAAPDDTELTTGRRRLMKGGFVAAVAAVVGLGSSRRVQGANGDPLEVGSTTNGTSTTTLTGGTTLRVINGTSSGGAALYGTQNSDGRVGVRGENSATSGTGIYGLATGSALGWGIHGRSESTDGMGVVGSAAGTGGAGLVGDGNALDLVADGSGRIGIFQVGQGGSPDSPGDGAVLARDVDGSLWWNYVANQWRKLAGPTTAGAFHPIDPIRAYDSRVATYPVNGLLASNQSRVVSVADGHDAVGAVTDTGAVPAGATAVAYNVTVTGTTASNFLSVVPGDAAAFTTSTINWSGANQSLANGSIVKLDASRQVKIFGGYDSGATHVIIDITGYFL